MEQQRRRSSGMRLVGALSLFLSACGGSVDQNAASRCNVPAGTRWLDGTVSAVHDGDTLTLNTGASTERILLQGLDAPELAQNYGSQARQVLSQLVLQQTVRVAYGQHDAYDRVLGQVFTGQCQDVNLQRLDAGMAWFYRAYACDLDTARRSRYAQAESQARALRRGLWSQAQPVAPWFFRNGDDPPEPACVP